MNIINKIKEKYNGYMSDKTEEHRKNLISKVNQEKVKKDFNKRLSKYHDDGIVLTTEQEAILFAQCIQLQFLKSPNSAVFSDFDEFNVEIKDDVYTVSGNYEAQNSYGGMRHDYFQISVQRTEDSWQYTVTSAAAKKSLIVLSITMIIIIGLIIFACSSPSSY